MAQKSIYKQALYIAIPLIIQNGVTNFIGMIDNIMLGQFGTEAMTGVSVANQLLFVLQLCVFGAVSGAGIYTAQLYGKGDMDAVKFTLKYKSFVGIIIAVLGCAIFLLWGDELLLSYIHTDDSTINATEVFANGKSYLLTMLIGTFPFALTQCYASTLRETDKPRLPMVASLVAAGVNLILNYLLIFGKFGFPVLGAVGAAIATVIARFVEAGIVLIYHYKTTPKTQKYKPSMSLINGISRATLFLLVNELLWSGGMAVLSQCYSLRGLSVIAAINIVTTLSNTFNVVNLSMGNAVGILIGQMLGAKEMECAKKSSFKLSMFSVSLCAIVGLTIILFSPFFPHLYDTTDEIRSLATKLLIIVGSCMPIGAFALSSYYILRSGGKAFITFMFDSGVVWVVSIPIAFFLSRFTEVPIIPMYLIINLTELVKCLLGGLFMKKGIWLNHVATHNN